MMNHISRCNGPLWSLGLLHKEECGVKVIRWVSSTPSTSTSWPLVTSPSSNPVRSFPTMAPSSPATMSGVMNPAQLENPTPSKILATKIASSSGNRPNTRVSILTDLMTRYPHQPFHAFRLQDPRRLWQVRRYPHRSDEFQRLSRDASGRSPSATPLCIFVLVVLSQQRVIS